MTTQKTKNGFKLLIVLTLITLPHVSRAGYGEWAPGKPYYMGEILSAGCAAITGMCFVSPKTPIPAKYNCSWGNIYIDISTAAGRGAYATGLSAHLSHADNVRVDFIKKVDGSCWADFIIVQP